jgi:serine/threonine protein phosphatase PrpC
MLPVKFVESAEKCFYFSALFQREIAPFPYFGCRKILMKTLYDKLLVLRDAGLQSGEKDRMATTLAVAIFGSDDISIGHVGDSRAYLI